MSYDDWLTTDPQREYEPESPDDDEEEPDETQELIEAIEEAIDALDFYAAPNCWGDPNVAAQTAEKLRKLLTSHKTGTSDI